jgi:hypothetical protein
VARFPTHAPTREARLERLAASIDSLSAKDAAFLRKTQEINDLRKKAAVELHTICKRFVASVNRLLKSSELALDPPDYTAASFQEDLTNLVQINVRGRILQISFSATGEMVSTEDFRVPYTLDGTVRAFNQESLAKDSIEEQLIFYTLEPHKTMWRYFDSRTYRSGPLDEDYLIGLMEQLL